MNQQRGQALPLAAIAALVLLAAAGAAVDTGYHQYQQRMQQTATDSAALAGAHELQNGDYNAAAQRDASNNGYADNTGGAACDTTTVGLVCVTVNNPPLVPDDYAGNSGAVEVQIQENHPAFFERVLGYTVVPVTTKAVAYTVNKAANGCIYVLDGSTTANFNGTSGGGTINATNCGLLFNGGANFNNSTVEAQSIECVQACSNGTYPSPYATPQPADPVSDPCPYISYCSHLAAVPPTCSSVTTPPTPDKTGNVSPPAGCYNGFTYHGTKNNAVTVNLCGLYVLTGTADISATGTGAQPVVIQETSGCPGVTFYITGSGAVNFKNANMTLSAPTSGDYSQYSAGEQNVLFYQASSDTNTAVLQSATCLSCSSNLVGMLYFPSSNLNYTKQNSTTTGPGALIISYDLNCNGCNATTFQAPAPGLQSIKTVVLGE